MSWCVRMGGPFIRPSRVIRHGVQQAYSSCNSCTGNQQYLNNWNAHKLASPKSNVCWTVLKSCSTHGADKPREPNVVYKGPLKTNIVHAKLFSFSSSIVGFLMQPYLIKNIGVLHPAAVAVSATILGFFTYLTPYLLHLIAKRYVTELTFCGDTKTFTCTTMNFFTVARKISFQATDVEVPVVPGMFTTFKVNGKPLFLDPKQFSDIDVYAHLMGYDKPIDFHMEIPKKEHPS